jgi:hypothetical protein
MTQSVHVSNMPSSDSKHRVAFDWAIKIAIQEPTPQPQNAREYYLNLYHDCYNVVVNGSRPKADAKSNGNSGVYL